MTSVMTSMRLDVYALFSQKTYAIIILCAFPLYAWAGLYSVIFILPLLFVLFTFYFEEKGLKFSMAAPINKTDKVTGRYLLLIAMNLSCFAFAIAFFAAFAHEGWAGFLISLAVSFSVFTIFAAFLLPCYFRFGYNAMTLLVTIAASIAFAIVSVLVGRTGLQPGELASASEHLVAQWFVLLPLACLALALSFAASRRIYLKRDL